MLFAKWPGRRACALRREKVLGFAITAASVRGKAFLVSLLPKAGGEGGAPRPDREAAAAEVAAGAEAIPMRASFSALRCASHAAFFSSKVSGVDRTASVSSAFVAPPAAAAAAPAPKRADGLSVLMNWLAVNSRPPEAGPFAAAAPHSSPLSVYRLAPLASTTVEKPTHS